MYISIVRWAINFMMICCSFAASTIGQEFYIGFFNNIGGGEFTNLEIVVGTSHTSAGFIVQSSNGIIHNGTATSNMPTVVTIESEFQVGSDTFENRQKGLRVYSTGSESIYVLAKNYVSFVNSGVYLAYPCQAFETESMYEYIAVSVDSDVALSQFLLVGCENDTEVTVVPAQTVSIPQDTQDFSSASTSIEQGSTSHRFIVHKMQTLLVSSINDLTGTRITSNKPLTVISGHECANVPSSATGCEPLAVQIPPTFTWGTEFLLSPFAGRNGAQTFKVVISENGTFLNSQCGTTSHEGRADTTFQFDADELCYLRASEPVLLVQLSFGESVDRLGDPAVSLISPIDQYIHGTEFLSLPMSGFSSNYISVTVTTEHYAPESILLDGTRVNCEWQEIRGDAIAPDIVGYGCSTIVSSDSRTHTRHTVTHSNLGGLISVVAYGFNTLPAQGYAYLTGQELKISFPETGIK